MQHGRRIPVSFPSSSGLRPNTARRHAPSLLPTVACSSLPGTPVDTPGSPAASSNCSSPSMPPRQPNLLKASRLGPGQSEPGSIACRLSDPGPPSLTDAHQSSPAPSMKPSASCNRLYDCAVAGPQSPTQVADAVKHAPLHLKGRCTMPPGLDDMVRSLAPSEPFSMAIHWHAGFSAT